MPLKEKVKKYIQSNYGKFSIAHLAHEHDCPIREVEDYVLEELESKSIVKEKESRLAELNKAPTGEKFSLANKLIIASLFICLITLAFALNISQMSNNDIWMHLKNGELILKNRHFLYKDTYSFRTIGMPWVNHEWLAGVIFYLIYQIGAVNALIFFKAFMVVLLTIFIVQTCRLTKDRWTVFYPIVVFALFNAAVRFLDRPHMFTEMFVPIFFYILFAYKYRHKDYLLWLPVLLLLWVNIHGGFVVGMGIITLFTLFETVRTIINRYYSFHQNDILSMRRLKKLWIIWLISGIILSVNPHGINIYTYPFELTSKKIFMSQIYEWQPPFKSPTFQASYAFTYFIIWMILLGLSFLLDWKHFDLTNAALSALFLAMSLRMHRNITTFALATAPIMSLNFDNFFDLILSMKKFINIKKLAKADLLAKVIILLITVGLTAMTFRYGYFYRSGSRKPFGLGVASNMPIEAVRYVKENHIKGNCFNPYTYGTYIIHELYPETRVVMDSRDLPYGERLYLEHQEAMVDVNAFKQMFQKYHIDYIILNYQQDDLREHFKYLHQNGEWVLVYFDDRNVVYIRNIPENRKLIERDGYFCLHPVLTLEKEGLELDEIPRYILECKRNIKLNPKFIFPRYVLHSIYLAQGKLTEAIQLGKEIVNLEPQNARWHILLAETYLRAGNIDQARAHYQQAITLDPGAEPFVRKKLDQLAPKAKG
ncbi:MAG: tetratricopeptide repeat protein [bacterium]|nr:tetratricopeptide repeat protein [bacterium]